jgi:hypothetical protein
MAQSYLASLLPGKEHLARLPDGGLLCKDVVVARSGPLRYLASELDLPGGEQPITVWRDPKEIKSRRFLASVEGATVTDMHPNRFVDPQTFQIYARGHAQNARVGPTDADGNVTALADLFIVDDGLSQKVESGVVRDISIGYNLDVVKDELGRWTQKNLRCNHVAVVPTGRCGSTKILDAASVLTLSELAAMYLGKDPASVSVPRHTTALDSRKEQFMEEHDDLISQTPTKEEALHWLRQIKPQVRRQGTDLAKRAWNRLYCLIRDGQNPALAVRDVREQISAAQSIAALDHAPTVAEQGAEFVRTCDSYLGRDIKEVEAERKNCRVPLRAADELFESLDETPTESFLRKVDEERQRQEKFFGY